MSPLRTPAEVLDGDTPGGVYLCQINATVSCGACCGLYNLAECSRLNLTSLLRARTRRFAVVPRTAPDIDRFAHETRCLEPQQRPLREFHHCPYIGWIGAENGCAGCLLHPLAAGNQGIDYRGLSYYGGLACRSYFCPTTHELASRYKRIVRLAASDWFAYGLVITEKELLGEIFWQIEMRLGRLLDQGSFSTRPAACKALMRLLNLKVEWPFRPSHWNTPCHYFFKENPRPKPLIDYRRIGARPSALDPILRELVSDFVSRDRLRQAERAVEKHLSRVVQELQEGEE